MHNYLGLDVGEKRIGVAVASGFARLARPLAALKRSDSTLDDIAKLAEQEDIGTVVIGLPRGMESQETEQTRITEEFISQLRQRLSIVIVTQDEALTSRLAETELNKRGKPYEKGDVDSLAATYILEDYLRSLPQLGDHEKNQS